MVHHCSDSLNKMPLTRKLHGLLECSSVFRISRASGLFMYYDSGRFSSSLAIFSMMKTFVTTALLIVTSVDYFLNDVSWQREMLSTSLGMEVIEVITQLISVHCHLLIMVLKRARFEAFLLNFNNETVKNVNRSARNLGLLNMLMIFITYGMMKYADYPNLSYKAIIRIFAYTAYGYLNFFILLQFTTILKLFRLKFLKLVDDFPTVIDIHKHAHLLRACEKVNSLYDWQLLFRVTHTFVNLLTHSSYIIGHFMAQNRFEFFLIRELFFLCNIMFTVYELFHLAGCCKQTKEAADLFVTELFNMLRGSQELCSNDKLYLYVTAKPTINFTACGFFYLGYPLVTSIIAAAATYLVIIVQFNMPR